MRVRNLWVYPVKSLGGIAISESWVFKTGMHYDRRWMIVEQDGHFLTQRTTGELATFTTELLGTGLQISRHMDEILVRFPPYTEHAYQDATIWGFTVPAIDMGDRPAEWLSRKLGCPVRLVYHPGELCRPIHPDYSQPGDYVSFADGFPLLLTTSSSLEDLNQRLPAEISMMRFRPNVEIEGCKAWEEDNWKRIRIGEVEYRNAKPCGRCIVTTLDPFTGQSTGQEPLTTLATFRKQEKGVNFGINLIPDKEGPIRVGDEVEIIE